MSITLNYTFEENELIHLSNTMFPCGYLREKILYCNIMNTKQKLEALYTMFFSNEFATYEFITDADTIQRVYRFYDN